MTIRSSLYFTYNGIRSDTYNILNVNIQGGMQSEPFAANRSIKEQSIRGNDRPYFMNLQYEPLEFTVSFAFKDSWDQDAIREVAIWLTSPKFYAPLVFAEDMDRIFYALCIDSPELVHNCLSQGYVNLHFRCMDAYSYTRTYNEIYDLSSNPASGTNITINNIGSEDCKPYIEILKVNSGSISIFNQSNGNAEMTIANLANNETIVVDCERRTINSDIPLTYHYSDLTGDYLSLPVYYNYLLIKGTCKIKFTYQFKRIQ